MSKKMDSEITYSRHLPGNRTGKEAKVRSSEIANYSQSGYKNPHQKRILHDGVRNNEERNPTSSEETSTIRDHLSVSHSKDFFHHDKNRGIREFQYRNTDEHRNNYSTPRTDRFQQEVPRADFSGESRGRYVESSNQQFLSTDKHFPQKRFHDESSMGDVECCDKPREHYIPNRHVSRAYSSSIEEDVDQPKIRGERKGKNAESENTERNSQKVFYRLPPSSSQSGKLKRYDDFIESSKQYPSELDFDCTFDERPVNLKYTGELDYTSGGMPVNLKCPIKRDSEYGNRLVNHKYPEELDFTSVGRPVNLEYQYPGELDFTSSERPMNRKYPDERDFRSGDRPINHKYPYEPDFTSSDRPMNHKYPEELEFRYGERPMNRKYPGKSGECDFASGDRQMDHKYPEKHECISGERPVDHRKKRNVSYDPKRKLSPKRHGEHENLFQVERDTSDFVNLNVGAQRIFDGTNRYTGVFSEGSLEEFSPDEEFQSVSKIVYRKYSTGKSISMKDVKKMADCFGPKLGQRNLAVSGRAHQQTSNSENVNCAFSQMGKRVYWAKQHLDDNSASSMVKRGSSMNRKNLFLANAVPTKGKNAWNAKKEKAKGKIKESLKEFFSKFQVWSSSLKFIEGHFGTSVVSYFVFLRWLLFLNLYIFIIFLVFIVLPQVYFPALQQRKNITTAPTTTFFGDDILRVSTKPDQDLTTSKNGDSLLRGDDWLKHVGSLLNEHVGPKILDATLYYDRTNYTSEERYNISGYCHQKYKTLINDNTHYDISSVIQDFFQGTGWMEFTVMFTGRYLPTDVLVYGTNLYYNLPVAFLSVLIVLCVTCIIMMANYASKGVREALLSTKSGGQNYCNMVFCGWDFCIANSRTAALKHKSILLELKSSLAEARRKQDIAQWTTLHKVKVYFVRFIVNIFVIASLVGTYYLIYYVAEIQIKEQRNEKQNEGFYELLIQFLPSITITALNFIMPLIFDVLVRYESYGTQSSLNITLVRIIFVRLASIIILVITFYRQINCEPKDMCGIGKRSCPSPICWETHVGQQMYRLVLMDFFVIIAVTFLWEVPRNFVVQKWKCKLTDMIGRQTFDIPSQVLAIVYAQTLCWLGVFYSPLLPVVCVIKVIVLFYLKKFTLIVNCVPSQIPYRSSRSNAVFVIVLMLNFLICVAILGYSISNIAPSPGCSPFRHLNFMIHAITEALNTWSPTVTLVLKYIFSTGFAITASVILGLAIYYYLTVTAAYKRMIKVLKSQLVLESRDKQFLLSRLTEVACQGMAKAD